MKIRTLVYSFIEALKGIRRNLLFFYASVGVVTASLFIFGIFFFVSSNIRNMVSSLEGRVGITVFFEEGLAASRKEDIGNEIRKLSAVSEVKYTSADEAWEAYKKRSLKPELIESFGGDNPLKDSDSYTIYVKKIEKQADLVKLIRDMEGVRKVNAKGRTADFLTTANRIINGISIAILSLLIGISIFLISTTISLGISVRKDEISIMRLIGATNFFVEAPFVIEGILIGVIGAILPLGLLYTLYEIATKMIMKRFASFSSFFSLIDINTEFRLLVPSILFMGIAIGFLGSFFTVRRHSNV